MYPTTISMVAQTQDRSEHFTEIFGQAMTAHWGANLGQKYGGNKNQGWWGGLKYKHFPVSLSNKTFPWFDVEDFSKRGLLQKYPYFCLFPENGPIIEFGKVYKVYFYFLLRLTQMITPSFDYSNWRLKSKNTLLSTRLYSFPQYNNSNTSPFVHQISLPFGPRLKILDV